MMNAYLNGVASALLLTFSENSFHRHPPVALACEGNRVFLTCSVMNRLHKTEPWRVARVRHGDFLNVLELSHSADSVFAV
jgi:hypothetical protein